MDLFDMTKEERRAYVASLLGCNLFTPEDWPSETIDRLLINAERAAESKLHDGISMCSALAAYRREKPN